jgi:2-aminoadipate transaminase
MLLAQRIEHLHSSPIREILSVIDQADMISFAGGLPAADTFPSFDFSQLPSTVWQYGSSEGEPALREWVAADLTARGISVGPEQVLILSGSQQGLDLVAKLLVDTGDTVAVESPTYLAALQVFRLFGANCAPIGTPQSKLIYTIPSFQNPTGHCLSLAERQALAGLADLQQTVLFEDDPYRDLVYDACDRQSVVSFVKSASWVYQGSFSKSLCPGLRVGYLAASKDLMPYLIRLKQAADLHTNRLGQHLVLSTLRDPKRLEREAHLQAFYRKKRDQFEAQLQAHFSELASWQTPKGGLFFWLTLKNRIDTRLLMADTLAQRVAFMPGEHFFATPELGHLRLNFSHASEAQMAQGLSRLANIIRQKI